MIKQEFLEVDGMTLVKTYSGSGFLIRQDITGDLYAEAIDPATAGRTYTETDIPADADENEDDQQPDYAESIAALKDAFYEQNEAVEERLDVIEDVLYELDKK